MTDESGTDHRTTAPDGTKDQTWHILAHKAGAMETWAWDDGKWFSGSFDMCSYEAFDLGWSYVGPVLNSPEMSHEA